MTSRFFSFGRLGRWLTSVAGVVVCGTSGAQVSQPSAIFGFVRTTLNGSGTQSGVTMVGPGFVEGVVQEAVLQAGAPRAFELTAVNESWAAGAYATHATVSSHFVEVTSSSNLQAVGLASDIVSHTATTLRIADDWSGVLRGGESIVIRPHKTLASLFGATNQAGLQAGDPLTADGVSLLNEGSSATISTYYYRDAGSTLGGTGWRSSANPFADETTRPIRAGQGVIVRRRSSAPLEVVLQGFVKTGIWRRTLPQGFALVDPLAPLTDLRNAAPSAGAAFTLGGTASASVIPSGLTAAVASGTPQTADLVTLAGSLASYYVAAPSGLSPGGWRLTSNPIVDQQNTVIPPATAMLIQNRGAAKQWARPQPFVLSRP